jgi:septal ring factor EnvC (AmiA/AmiB activator)
MKIEYTTKIMEFKDAIKAVITTIPNFYAPNKEQFIGVARYKNNDSFNSEIGKKIAFKKAKRQMISFQYNILMAEIEKMKKQIDYLTNEAAKCSEKKKQLTKEIKELAYKEN